MKFKGIENSLNDLATAAGIDAEFFTGDIKNRLPQIVNKICPSGNAAVFTNDGGTEKSKIICGILAECDVRTAEAVIAGDISLTVDNMCGVFNLPDDVRAAVVTDVSLFGAAAYFARVRNVPLIIIPSSYDVGGSLCPYIYIKNGSRADRVAADIKRYVVIDEDFLDNGTVCDGFARIMSKITALADYRISRAAGGRAARHRDAAAYELARKAVTGTYSLFAADGENRFCKLLESGFSTEIADAVSGGRLFAASAADLAGFLTSPFRRRRGIEFFASLKIIKLYGIWLDSETKPLNFTDYVGRAEKIAGLCGVSENAVMKLLSEQLKILRARSFAAVKKDLQGEYRVLQKTAGRIEKIYYALGGKKPHRDMLGRMDEVLPYTGDCGNCINGMSLMREEGFSEQMRRG